MHSGQSLLPLLAPRPGMLAEVAPAPATVLSGLEHRLAAVTGGAAGGLGSRGLRLGGLSLPILHFDWLRLYLALLPLSLGWLVSGRLASTTARLRLPGRASLRSRHLLPEQLPARGPRWRLWPPRAAPARC